MKKYLTPFALLSILVAGCASNTSVTSAVLSPSKLPSDEEIAWANRITERRDQQTVNNKSVKLPSNNEIALAIRILDYGSPSPAEIAWANKIIELNAQQEECRKQITELAQERQMSYTQMVKLASERNELEDVQNAIENIKKEAKADNQLVDYLAKNKEQLKNDATQKWSSTKQERFESFGQEGDVIKYWVDDVTIEGKSVLSYSQVFCWKKANSQGITRIKLGYDIQSKMFVGYKIINNTEFSPSEMAAIANGTLNENKMQVISHSTHDHAPSSWTPNNETINSLYQATIDIFIFAAEKYIEKHMQN